MSYHFNISVIVKVTDEFADAMNYKFLSNTDNIWKALTLQSLSKMRKYIGLFGFDLTDYMTLTSAGCKSWVSA